MVPPKNGFLALRLPIFGSSYYQCFYTFGIAPISVPDGAPSGTAPGGIANPAYTVAAPNTRTAGGPVLNPSMDNVGKTSEGGVSGLSQPPLVSSIANAKTNQVQSKKARHRHG